MTRSIAALIALLAGITNPVGAQTVTAEGVLEPEAVACLVDGYDVVLVNSGAEALPVASQVAWSVRFARMEGVHELAVELAPGARHVLTGALGSSYLPSRTPCEAYLAGQN